MNYSIQIDRENKFIRYTHTGVIVREDVGAVWDELLQLDEFTSQGYNMLSDYRKGKLKGAVSEMQFILNFLSSIKNIVQDKKQALLMGDPLSTAFSLLFERHVYNRTGFRVKVFSTEEAAIEWLTR